MTTATSTGDPLDKEKYASDYDPSDLKLTDVKTFAGQAVVDLDALLDGYTGAKLDSQTLSVLADLKGDLLEFARGVFERHGRLDEAVRNAPHTAEMRVYGERR